MKGAIMAAIDTDYLVIGAGLSGLAFADSLIADSDADVVLADRRPAPGGHWNDAYPFLRLHMSSASYGVNNLALGGDMIDESGLNAGLYERATGHEVCAYFQRVLDERLLASGQARFLGMREYVGDGPEGHVLQSRLTGETTTVRVRRKLVDATFLEGSVPSRHTPAFAVDPDVRLVSPNELVRLGEPGTGFTVLGAGKTAMDTCQWLLDQGVAPDRIRWVRPRDAWLLDRAFYQPLTMVTTFIEGVARQVEAAAQAESVADLFERLEDGGQLVRLDPTVEPAMFHGASVSVAELESLRRIERVVRMGRVVRLSADRIVLKEGSVPSDPGEVYVDCTAVGLKVAAARPVFEPHRITIQQVRQSQPSLNAALIGYVEATRDNDAEKNHLCPSHPYPDSATDWIRWTRVGQRIEATWSREPDVQAWLGASRLNLSAATGDYRDDPRMQSAITRFLGNAEAAVANLERLSPTERS